jgi:hypothetical protein
VLDETLDVVDGGLGGVVAVPRVVRLWSVKQLLPDPFRTEAPAAVPAGTIDWPNPNWSIKWIRYVVKSKHEP